MVGLHVMPRLVNFGLQPLRSTRHKILKNDASIACDMSYYRSLDASTTTPEHRTIR